MDWLSIAAPALFAAAFTSIGGLVVWYLQSRIERIRQLEQKLSDDRRRLYAEALDPFIRIFAGIKDPKQTAIAMKNVTSYEYRRTVFHLTLFGSDEVVRAYNDMMQHIYQSETEGRDNMVLIRMWGHLLLTIRRSVGNEKTALADWEMLASTLSDVEALKRS